MKVVVEFNDKSEVEHRIINFSDISYMGYGLVLIKDTSKFEYDYYENEIEVIKLSEL